MRVVIDTNVLFEGLFRKGECGSVIDLWVDGTITPCVSTSLALEYEDVLSRRPTEEAGEQAKRALQALLARAEFVAIHFSYRPLSPDPADDHVIDCAMNGRAAIVTSNTRHFKGPAAALGFELMTPKQLLAVLEEG